MIFNVCSAERKAIRLLIRWKDAVYQIISKDLIQRVMGKGREGGGVGERADVSSKNREGRFRKENERMVC